MPVGRVIVHVVAVTGLSAVAVAFGRWLREPALDLSLALVLALAATCALALRRLYGPGGIVALPREGSRERPRPSRAPEPGPRRPEPLWSSSPASPAPVDLNSAPEDELRTLPGVGPVLAARIAAARPFGSVADLAAVPGFTDARVRAIADRVRV